MSQRRGVSVAPQGHTNPRWDAAYIVFGAVGIVLLFVILVCAAT